jgi:hypothetical protein
LCGVDVVLCEQDSFSSPAREGESDPPLILGFLTYGARDASLTCRPKGSWLPLMVHPGLVGASRDGHVATCSLLLPSCTSFRSLFSCRYSLRHAGPVASIVNCVMIDGRSAVDGLTAHVSSAFLEILRACADSKTRRRGQSFLDGPTWQRLWTLGLRQWLQRGLHLPGPVAGVSFPGCHSLGSV